MAFTYKKERNFIVGYEGDTLIGKWNIITGEFIGKSGKVVKNFPACFSINTIANNLTYARRIRKVDITTYILIHAIHFYQQYYKYEGTTEYYTEQRGTRMEQLISLNLEVSNIGDLDTTEPLTKDIVAYLKENNNSYYNSGYVKQYYFEKRHPNFMNDKPNWFRRGIFSLIIDNESMPEDYIIKMAKRYYEEHIYYLTDNGSNFLPMNNFIKTYYKYSMTLYGEVKVVPNLASVYANLSFYHEQYKIANYDNELKKNNDKSFLYFENENYIVKPILSKVEFHEEAEAQHNCVERLYMEKVYENTTYIVSVREKSNPDVSFITCEVSHSGHIIQYFKRYNTSVTYGDSAFDFKMEYARHLKESMGIQ